ncbi:helix-turn-helix domain-containing protein [Mesobacillus subterraneus]|uniref:helix-turn-helix domain-containing protein n=1 Tax=Mesobacillus subterraneus TaxID=285983 RepID=UPI00204269E1|nr:helix-turn-helix domain-containing protein [Mesobacillus subterraneus]MCM3576279.1 helix-turn-helix domain-containing protein [Mesobacillus subterraneus]
MEIYNVDEAFEVLKANKLTTHKESVRRWLRQGLIKGIPPTSRKEGWKISAESLNEFMKKRLPEIPTKDVVKEKPEVYVSKSDQEIEEDVRASIWLELANKHIWEGFIEIKKTQIRDCIKHRRYSSKLEEAVWKACLENSRAYSKPRVFYLLGAFGFDRKRISMDTNFGDIEEQIIFPIIEYVRKKQLQKQS